MYRVVPRDDPMLQAATLRERALGAKGLHGGVEDPELSKRARAILRKWNTDFSARSVALDDFLNAAGILDASEAEQILGVAAPPPMEVRRAFDFLSSANLGSTVTPGGGNVVDLVLGQLLKAARSNAERRLSDRVGSTEWELSTLRTVMREPPVELKQLMEGPLLVVEHALAQCQGGATTSQSLTHVHGWLQSSNNGILDFFELFPALARLVVARLEQWSTQSVLLSTRLYRDRRSLEAWLHLPEIDVEAAYTDMGDRHMGGASTSRIVVTGSKSVIYKPRPIGTQRLLKVLLRVLPEHLTVRLPEAMERDGYGWVEFLHHSPCRDDAGVKRYFRRLGSFAALAWCLGSRDLHGFNLIAVGEWPYVVDHETVLSPYKDTPGMSYGAWLLAESPIGTGMLPFAHASAGYAISALGGDEALLRSADIDLHDWNVHLPSRTSIPYQEDRGDVDPLEYSDTFLAGFNECLEVLSLRGPDHSFRVARDCPVRIVLRPTADYGRLLSDGDHPDLLTDQLLREGHFNSLRLTQPLGMEPAIVTAEVAELINGNIPYFWTTANSLDLHVGDSHTVRSYFHASPLDEMGRHWRTAATKRDWGVWVVQNSLGIAALARDPSLLEARCCLEPIADATNRSRTLQRAVELVTERLMALAVTNPYGSDVGWLDVAAVGGGPTWEIKASGLSLYSGALGTALFLAAVGTLWGWEEPIRLSRGVVRSWAQYRDEPGDRGVGAYNGLFGDLYGLVVLDSYLDEPYLKTAIDELVATACMVSDNSDQLDVISGSAGALLTLLRLRSTLPGKHHEVIETTLERLGRQLMAVAVPTNSGVAWPTVGGACTVGFGHGSTGISLSLRWLSHHTGRREFAEVADRADVWEETQLTRSKRAWRDLRPSLQDGGEHWSTSWCNGSAGIGLARLKAVGLDPNLRGRYEADIARAVDLAVDSGLGYGQSLCDGDMSQVELVRLAGQTLDVPQMTELASAMAHMVAQSVVDSSGEVSSGYGFMKDRPGLMTGSAGVGIGLLRELEPELVPSPVTLEPP